MYEHDRLKLGWPVAASKLVDDALGRLAGVDMSIENIGLDRTARDLETVAYLLRATATELRATAKVVRAQKADPRQQRIPGA